VIEKLQLCTRFVAGNKIQFVINHISERVFFFDVQDYELDGSRQTETAKILQSLYVCSTVVISGLVPKYFLALILRGEIELWPLPIFNPPTCLNELL
jgi:hypothetical protein